MRPKSLFVFLLLSTTFAGGVSATAPGVPIEGIAAVVNHEVVLLSDLERRVKSVRSAIEVDGNPMPPADVLRRQVLDRLIMERVQLQRADELGITVSEDRLNQAINGIARANQMTLEQFHAAVAADGLDFADVREEIRTELITTQLRQRDVLARVNVTQREVDAFLAGEGAEALDNREFRVQHIMLRVSQDASPDEVEQVRSLGTDIIARARDGEDFGALAAAHSAGQQALEGGELGWRRSTQLPSAFAERVIGMEAGDVSELIRTPGALHIIKLNDVRGGGERIVVDQTRARHILIRTTPIMTDARVRARLTEIRDEILAGGDFGAMARRHSEDPGSAVNNGDLGWIEPGSTVPAFETVMSELDIDEISEPFATDYGWHIVQVRERRAHDGTDQARVAQARRVLRDRKAEEQGETWLMRLLDEAYIENRLGD